MSHRVVYRVSLITALFVLLAVVSGTAAAQTVDDVGITLSDTDGDGLDDSFVVNVQVTEDGAATAVRVDGPLGSLEVPSGDDGGSQAPVTNVSGNTATFGSTGYTGTYTVEGTLSEQSERDTLDVTAWVGGVDRSQADDVREASVTIMGMSETDDEDSGEVDEGSETPNESTTSSENNDDSDEGSSSDETNDTDNESGDGNLDDGGEEADENGTDNSGSESLPGFTAVVALFALVMVSVGVRH